MASTGFDRELPELDDRLVEPGTPFEMLDGELVRVPPADDPHALREGQVCVLVGTHLAAPYSVAAELLTRTSRVDDIAPDVSVLPPNDPVTGRRRLQEIVFEVVSTQTMRNAARKAAKLAARGVRRVFAIDVERSRALEWSAALGTWSVLDRAGRITDPVFAVPLPVELLVQQARTDDAVARALIGKRNAVLEELRAEGLAEGLAAAVAGVLAARGIALEAEDRARILGERDRARLERWIARAATCSAAAELLGES
jgi:hypothetical protein